MESVEWMVEIEERFLHSVARRARFSIKEGARERKPGYSGRELLWPR